MLNNSLCKNSLAILLMIVCVGLHAAPQSLVSSRQNQESLDLTIYNNFAVVRDVREMVLPKGEVLLEYRDVANTLKPSSVLAKSLGSCQSIRVLEQSYRYDLLNRQSLLETYIGRKLKYSRTVLLGNTYEKVLREGILLSTDPEIVDFGDEIEIAPEGTISLPIVPDGLILNPSLVWLLDNPKVGKQKIETTYMANSLAWHADYVLALDEQTNRLNLTSWATIRNDSGTQFKDARIKLIAGNVNQVYQEQPKVMRAARESMMLMADAAPQISELAAYQAFELPRTTSLLNHEEKQIKFIESENVTYEQRFRLRTPFMAYANQRLQSLAVMSEIRLDNQKGHNLGLPLPAGTARVYVQTAGGPELIGESQFAATPLEQSVTLALGQAFDITAERQQMRFSRLSDRVWEAEYELKLSNAKAEALKVEVLEAMQGDWELLEASQESTRPNGQTLRFDVAIPARGEKTVRYRVRWKN
jgi:hypothetical protein